MVKNPPTNAGDTGSVPGWRRSPGEGNGNPIQYSCLGNPMDRGAWWATVHGVAVELELTQEWVFVFLPNMHIVKVLISNNLTSENIFLLFSSVQSLSRVRLFATPLIAARQASLSITNSQSSLKIMSIELVMPSSHLILRCPLLLLPPIPPSIRVFSNESTLRMRWLLTFNFPSSGWPGPASLFPSRLLRLLPFETHK